MSNKDSDEPARLQKIIRALSPHVNMERIKDEDECLDLGI